MSQSSKEMYKSTARQLSVRSLDTGKMKSLLRYGDIGKIAVRTHYHYQHVSRVIRDERANDHIWKAVANYLDSLPTIEIESRLAEHVQAA